MELWNECLLNEKPTTEIKSQVIGCQSQIGKFDLFFRLHLGHNYSEKMSAASSKQLANLIISLL